MKKRVYVIEYKIHTNILSLGDPKMESRTQYFSKSERDMFIDEYYRLKDKYYIQDLETYFAELYEIRVESIVNSI